MQIFEKTITTTQNDLDALNHVNNVRYVQWVQDIAEQHWLSRASQNILDKYFWVMLSHHITYKSPAFVNDQISLKTFVIKSEGVTSTRVVEIRNANTRKLLAESETKWCFMSKETQKPARITSDITSLFC
ncbi:acyl-CoA thioesterase [Hanstruepera marina]|uniref:acyl-CoA thioesterase n=1 Tax=Hanstruepera marina TaxID=2873265 RepID=UPI001CA6A385|nr:thioesterase family protein [Hanstruepera marina]